MSVFKIFPPLLRSLNNFFYPFISFNVILYFSDEKEVIIFFATFHFWEKLTIWGGR